MLLYPGAVVVGYDMAHARMSAHTYVTHYLRAIRAAALDDGSA